MLAIFTFVKSFTYLESQKGGYHPSVCGAVHKIHDITQRRGGERGGGEAKGAVSMTWHEKIFMTKQDKGVVVGVKNSMMSLGYMDIDLGDGGVAASVTFNGPDTHRSSG